MLKGDEDNFLKLAAALKIILGRSICLTELPRAQALLESYLATFLKVGDEQEPTRSLLISIIPSSFTHRSSNPIFIGSFISLTR